MKIRILALTVSLFWLVAAAPARERVMVSIPESHSRLILSAEEIAVMRENALSGREPWHGSWQDLQGRLEECFRPGRQAGVYTGDNSHDYYLAATRDGSFARDLAMAYHISGEERYARKALEIIECWMEPDPMPGTLFDPAVRYPNTGMEVARATFPFLYAYDLLCAGDQVPDSTCDRFGDWLRTLLPHVSEGARRWQENDWFDRQYYQSHIAAEVLGLMSMGIILRDEELVSYSVDCELNARDALDVIEGVILMEGQNPYYREPVDIPPADGEIMDRYRHFSLGGHYGDYVTQPGRGLQYCGLTSAILVTLGEMGRLNGADLYGWTAPSGECIKLPLLYYADFYIQKTTLIKSGFYAGEDDRINTNDTATFCLWEVARCRFPEEEMFRRVLETNERGSMTLHLLGPVTLTHGR